jgi:hypothetical protein
VIDGYSIEGHAIVSADDRIADASGQTPAVLRNEADWQRFQAALDRAVVTALGRLAHEANPNHKGRNRMVLSASARGIERRDDAWWWNPAEVDLAEALAVAAPVAGTIAVPGGRRVFDLFLSIGFDAFYLARVPTAKLPDGIPIFSEVTAERGADDVLASHGLVAGKQEILDPAAGVELVSWRRP